MTISVTPLFDRGSAYADEFRDRSAGVVRSDDAFSELLDRPIDSPAPSPADEHTADAADHSYDDTPAAQDDRDEAATGTYDDTADDTRQSRDRGDDNPADPKDDGNEASGATATDDTARTKISGKFANTIHVVFNASKDTAENSGIALAAMQAGQNNAQATNANFGINTAKAAGGTTLPGQTDTPLAGPVLKGAANDPANGTGKAANAAAGATQAKTPGQNTAAQAAAQSNTGQTQPQTDAAKANIGDIAKGPAAGEAATQRSAAGSGSGDNAGHGLITPNDQRADQQVLSALASRSASARARGNAVDAGSENIRIELRLSSAERATELHNAGKRTSIIRQMVQKELADKATARSTLTETPHKGLRNAALASADAQAGQNSNGLPFLIRQNTATPQGSVLGGDGSLLDSKSAPGIDTAGDNSKQAPLAVERQSAMAQTARNAAVRMPLPNMPSPPAEQVRVQFQNAVKAGQDRIHVQLSPASLGKVEVKLEVGADKAVHAVVYAEKAETLHLLERDSHSLQRALEDAGLKTDSNSLSFQHGSAQQDNTPDSDGSAAARVNGDTAGSDGHSDIAAADADDTPRRSSHDGLLDLEV